MPTLDEILQGSKSESFRRLNRGLAGTVPGVGPRATPRKVVVVDAPAPHPVAKPDLGQALERYAEIEGGGAPRALGCPHVHFYLHRVHLLDADNKYASVKPFLDALRHAGLIPNDRDSDITLSVTQLRVRHRHLQGTGVAITYSEK